jgi:lysozyme
MVIKGKVHGPDIYEGEGSVDLTRVAAHGAKFVIFKISEGDYMDSRATVARVKAIRDAGMIAGAYVFLRPKAGRTGAQEFRIFFNKGREIGLWNRRDGGKTRDLRPVLDCEATGFSDTVLGRLQTRRYIRQAVRECKRLTGHYPIIYTGKYWWEDTIKCRSNMKCRLWLASYPLDSSRVAKPPAAWLPSAWKEVDLWQFSDHYKCPGINENERRKTNSGCDYNVYVGKGGAAGFRSRLTF